MKNNEKGFVAISILYSVFILFILILISLMLSYISDRKMSNKIKDDIKNQFSIGTPDIKYSQYGSDITNSSYSVQITITSQINIDTIKYIWSTTQTGVPNVDIANEGSATLQLSGVKPAGNYYLITKACDIEGNCTTMISKKFVLGS